MSPGKTISRRGALWRASALLAVGAAVGMATVASPAGAHVGGSVNHLWKHLRPKADKRYLPGGTLPRGRTIRGTFFISGNSGGIAGIATGSISFGWKLRSAPQVHVILQGAAAPAECPGTITAPAAKPGHLCIYEGSHSNRSALITGNPVNGAADSATRYGVGLFLASTSSGLFLSGGTWAVRSP